MAVLVYQKSMAGLKKREADEVKFVDVYATAAKWKEAVSKIADERVRECAGGFCAHMLARVRVTNRLKGK